MKNIIIYVLLAVLFVSANTQKRVDVLHFNYKWNDKNSYDLRGIKYANVKYVWVEEQPKSIQNSIQSVPVIALIGRDGKVKYQFTAGLSFKIKATKEEIQKEVNKIYLD